MAQGAKTKQTILNLLLWLKYPEFFKLGKKFNKQKKKKCSINEQNKKMHINIHIC